MIMATKVDSIDFNSSPCQSSLEEEIYFPPHQELKKLADLGLRIKRLNARRLCSLAAIGCFLSYRITRSSCYWKIKLNISTDSAHNGKNGMA